MVNVLGENYFIDLDAVEDYLDMSLEPSIENSGVTETKVNLIKFEMVKMLLEVILSEDVEMDEKMKVKNRLKLFNATKIEFIKLI